MREVRAPAHAAAQVPKARPVLLTLDSMAPRPPLQALWSAVPDPEPIRTVMEFCGAVGEWIKERHPSEYVKMFTREGRFIRSRENGERAVRLGRQYRSTVTT